MDEGNYSVSRYGDKLEPGVFLKISHAISVKKSDLSSLAGQGADALSTMYAQSAAQEQKLFEAIVEATNQWEQQAVQTQQILRAQQYLQTPQVRHTNNRWQKLPDRPDMEEISNRVYRMTCSVYEQTKYDSTSGQLKPITWYVSWEVSLNTPAKDYQWVRLIGQDNKRYTDPVAAMKYLDGRKKACAHLFTQISPPIPAQYERYFQVHGTLLPGYTVEQPEPFEALDERATTEKVPVADALARAKAESEAREQERQRAPEAATLHHDKAIGG